LCPANELPCNAFGCYNPAREICHKIREGGTKCKKEEQVCVLGEYARTGHCYNSSTHACLRDNDYVWTGKVCELGEKMCRYECFNPTTQECHGHIICKMGDLLCGATCYDPKLQQCSQKKLCDITEKACNGHCYHKITQGSCFAVDYDELYYGITKSTTLW